MRRYDRREGGVEEGITRTTERDDEGGRDKKEN